MLGNFLSLMVAKLTRGELKGEPLQQEFVSGLKGPFSVDSLFDETAHQTRLNSTPDILHYRKLNYVSVMIFAKNDNNAATVMYNYNSKNSSLIALQ